MQPIPQASFVAAKDLSPGDIVHTVNFYRVRLVQQKQTTVIIHLVDLYNENYKARIEMLPNQPIKARKS